MSCDSASNSKKQSGRSSTAVRNVKSLKQYPHSPNVLGNGHARTCPIGTLRLPGKVMQHVKNLHEAMTRNSCASCMPSVSSGSGRAHATIGTARDISSSCTIFPCCIVHEFTYSRKDIKMNVIGLYAFMMFTRNSPRRPTLARGAETSRKRFTDELSGNSSVRKECDSGRCSVRVLTPIGCRPHMVFACSAKY